MSSNTIMLKSYGKNVADYKIREFNQIFSYIADPISDIRSIKRDTLHEYIRKNNIYHELSMRYDLGYPAFWSVCTLYKKN